jgi:hypothetical protein
MPVHHDPVTTSATEQLIQRHASRFGFDVPQRGVHGGNCRHSDRASAPIGTAVKVLPDIFDLRCIATNQARNHMVFQVRHNGEFPAIERGITDAVETIVSGDLQRNEVAARAGNYNVRMTDLHDAPPASILLTATPMKVAIA